MDNANKSNQKSKPANQEEGLNISNIPQQSNLSASFVDIGDNVLNILLKTSTKSKPTGKKFLLSYYQSGNESISCEEIYKIISSNCRDNLPVEFYGVQFLNNDYVALIQFFDRRDFRKG